LPFLKVSESTGNHDSAAASIEETLALWAASVREIKQGILFRQERVATNAGLFLDGLFGDEQRKTGWMRAEAIPVAARRSAIALIRRHQENQIPNPGKNQRTATPLLIRWSIQEIRRIAIRLAERGFNPLISWHGHSGVELTRRSLSARTSKQKATVMLGCIVMNVRLADCCIPVPHDFFARQ
jgi:hypothetical protein